MSCVIMHKIECIKYYCIDFLQKIFFTCSFACQLWDLSDDLKDLGFFENLCLKFGQMI